MKDFLINEKSEKLIQLYTQGKWREVLQLFEDEFYDERFLWVRPMLDNLSFIGREVGESLLVSVGCGCGLLEWLIASAAGIDVVGLEVDRKWWESMYAPPAFLSLHFIDEKTSLGPYINGCNNGNKTTLLFCYFNNRPAFEEYVRCYDGSCIIIIGPGKGHVAHTDPEPFDAKLPRDWTITVTQPMSSTGDHIVVYRR